MQSCKCRWFAALAAFVLAAAPAVARASSFSSVIVYGDSLSDNGNLFSLIGYPPSPYYDGRFSNGPVAVEQLATLLGAPLDDFAVGGATSGLGNYADGGTQTAAGSIPLPGMAVELAASAPLLASPLVPSALFVVWGGANDFISGGSAMVAAYDVASIVGQLESDGAEHILVPGLPDLALTPDYYGSTAAATYTAEFNAALQTYLPPGAIYFDTNGLLQQIEGDPAAYGLTDTTDPCFNGVTVCANPSQYLFWDGFHPTTTVDTIVADDFAAAVTTPEPSSLLLLGTGLAGLGVALRRRKVV